MFPRAALVASFVPSVLLRGEDSALPSGTVLCCAASAKSSLRFVALAFVCAAGIFLI